MSEREGAWHAPPAAFSRRIPRIFWPHSIYLSRFLSYTSSNCLPETRHFLSVFQRVSAFPSSGPSEPGEAGGPVRLYTIAGYMPFATPFQRDDFHQKYRKWSKINKNFGPMGPALIDQPGIGKILKRTSIPKLPFVLFAWPCQTRTNQAQIRPRYTSRSYLSLHHT